MPQSPLRYDKLLRVLPKHKHAKGALLEAGFTEYTADTQAKRVLASAIKHQARAILKGNDQNAVSAKRLMNEIVGLSQEHIFERLRYIANQDKDLNSALKVLTPLVREHGVLLSQEEDAKVQVPILNVTVSKTDDVPITHEQVPSDRQEVLNDGSIEPKNDVSVAQ